MIPVFFCIQNTEKADCVCFVVFMQECFTLN